jgi:hypothetical protein
MLAVFVSPFISLSFQIPPTELIANKLSVLLFRVLEVCGSILGAEAAVLVWGLSWFYSVPQENEGSRSQINIHCNTSVGCSITYAIKNV